MFNGQAWSAKFQKYVYGRNLVMPLKDVNSVLKVKPSCVLEIIKRGSSQTTACEEKLRPINIVFYPHFCLHNYREQRWNLRNNILFQIKFISSVKYLILLVMLNKK